MLAGKLQRDTVIEKNNFRSFIYGQRPTNLANFVKIGPVDVETIGLTEITKYAKKNKTSAKHKPSSSAICAKRVS